jgi:hypothetical protein
MNVRPYKELVGSLRSLGLTKAQVHALLPDWWDVTAATSPAGAWEFVLMISRRLGLDASALAAGEVRLRTGVSAPRFKHTVRVTPEALQPATRIASSLVSAVVGAMTSPATQIRMSAEHVRDAVLARQPRVDFDGLLNFAWEHGIAVVPLPNLPSGVKRMDAAAMRADAHPAIVIARKTDSKAWLSFVLAHELGHVLLGHLPNDGAIVEGSLKDTTDFEAESQLDDQELEANAFAHAVLGGPKADAVIEQWPRRASMMQLVDSAIAAAPALHAAPGHLILRHAFLSRRWAEAAMALRFIADDMDAQKTLITHMASHVDTRLLGEDLQDFVEQVTGIAARAA